MTTYATVNPATVLKRTFRLQRGQSAPPHRRLDPMLTALPGVVETRLERSGRRLKLRYDATQIALDAILQRMDEIGIRPATGVWQRLKQAWYRYVDETVKENNHVKGGACCSNPADIYAQRHKR
jgi:hypothetical protein